ncbi:MAG TPA: hypothetical protein VGO63_01620 [Candidatus Paceibacterota bacterium]|jgi:hypothetical protein|nr:hypothetical protein [Candidatus Paceibacterota bacterium]
MALNDRNKLNRIEELKTKLFSKNYQTKIEHRDSFMRPNRPDVPDSWGDVKKPESDGLGYQEKFFMKTSRFKKFFIFSIVFFVLTLTYGGYVFFFAANSVSNNNIDISILGNTFTAGGDELSLVVGITNRNSSALDLVDLVVEYPKGGDADMSSGTEHFRQSLGSIPAGGVHNENVKLVLFGQQGAVRPIKVSIEYRIAGSNAIFVKEKPYQVTISSTPVNLLIDAPATISPNQDIVLNIKSTLNATQSIPDVLLRVDYPAGFQFVSANPAPSMGNNVWNMGDLAPGVDRNIAISGRMLDVIEGEEKNFRVSSGQQSATDKSAIGVVFNSLTHLVTVKRPFIEANLSINDVSTGEYTVNSKTAISGRINWSNNLNTKIDDLVIKAKISGNAYNTKTVTADQGTYDSLQGLITWDKFSQSQFTEINPGDFGSVNFSISPVALYSVAGGILADPSIKIEISISGKQLTEGYQPQELNNSESKVIKVISEVGFNPKASYSAGPFTNTGAIPPKAEKETTYTVTWALSNTSNNISKAEVRAVLPTWVRFIGPISPATENLAYNSSSREMVWNVGRIPKGAGITGSERTVSFQIGFVPLLSQINTVPAIVNEAVLTGHDDFANVGVRVTRPALLTDIKGDASFSATSAVVAP